MRAVLSRLLVLLILAVVALAVLFLPSRLGPLSQEAPPQSTVHAEPPPPRPMPAMGMFPEGATIDHTVSGSLAGERTGRQRLTTPIPDGESEGFAPIPGTGRADEPLPVKLKLIADGVDGQGKWFQTFRVTIQPGGALFYVALALYNDAGRADEIFHLVHNQVADVSSPGLVRPGLSFLVTVDPSSTFVLGQSTLGPDGTKTRVYYNGVREFLYPGDRSVQRVIDFPPVVQTRSFSLSDEGNPLQVPAGFRLVDYQYVPSEDFHSVLRQSYGVASIPALNDFIKEVGWDFNKQLPQPGEKHRLIFSTTHSYDDVKVPPSPWAVDDPAARQKLAQLNAERERVGVRLKRAEPSYLVYQVGVMDPHLTAKDLSKLLFGRETAYVRLAALAGIEPPDAAPASGTSQTQADVKVPASFNPVLFGKVFEVQVDLGEEYFPWQETSSSFENRRTTTLLNGTVIDEYSRVLQGRPGVQQIVHYPSGYRKVVYRPDGITLTLLDGLVFVYQIFADSSIQVRPDDTRLDAKLRLLQQKRMKSLPKLVWDWDPAAPCKIGDVAQRVGWYGDQQGKVVEALLLPRSEVSAREAYSEGQIYVRVLPAAALIGVAFAVIMAAIFSRRQRWHSLPR